jgi:peptidoglycan/LPS O-acetylase OafA/YrhL
MLSPQNVNRWARLDGVDLLRGLAIFFVLMNHANLRLLFAKVRIMQALPHIAGALVWNGQNGVQIFFAVSGFLITSTSLRRWGGVGQVEVGKFYLLRFARIAPLLLLLLAVLSGLHLAHVHNYVVSQKVGGLRAALFAALTFHVNVLEARRGYLPANWDILWSLSVEEVFYFGFPLACRLFRRARWLAIPLLVFVVVGPFARAAALPVNEVWYEYSYLGGMDAIAMGCLTALVLAKRRLTRVELWVVAVLGATLVVFTTAFATFVSQVGLERRGLDMSLLAVGTCMLIALFAQTQWRAPRVLRLLLTLGQRSYEVYLTHMFVVFGLFALFLRWGKPMRGVPVLFVAAVVLAGVLGELVALLYSEPMNRWIRARFVAG